MERIVALARSRIGHSRYQLGSDPTLAPEIVDCSSFTQWAFEQIGVEIPRLSAEQALVATRVTRGNTRPGDLRITRGDMRPGDLIFMEGRCYRHVPNLPPDHVGHVGIVAEDLTHFIHATHRPNGVHVGLISLIPPWRLRFFGRIEI